MVSMRSSSVHPTIVDRIVPHSKEVKRKVLTREEWLARRLLRREKQRTDNVVRAAKMHNARLQAESNTKEGQHASALKS
jgi:hypothetical protein